MKRKYIIIATVIILIAIILLWLLLLSRGASGTLKLQAIDNTPNNADVTVQIKTEETAETLTLRPGETREVQLKPGTVQVTGSAGELKAVDIVEIEKSSTTSLTTPVAQNRAIKQIGSNARICPVLIGEQIYSYNCQGSGVVVRNTPEGDSTLFGGRPFSSLQPVNNGLIGFYADDTKELQYLDLANETISPVQLPGNVQNLLSEEIPRMTTTGEPGNSRFALMFHQADVIYLFDDLADQDPAELKPGADVKLNELARFTAIGFSGDRFTLYAGNNIEGEEGVPHFESPEEHTPDLPSYIFEYGLNGELVNTIDLPEEFTAQAMYKLVDNYYVAEWRDAFKFYYHEDGELKLIHDLFGVANWAVLQNKAYIQEGGTLYEFAPTENGLFSLHSLFSSSDLRVSRVFATPKGIVFTGFAGTSTDAPLNIYQLLDDVAEPSTPPPGIVQHDVTYENLDDLLEYGITATQVDALEKTFDRYIESRDINASQITIQNIQPVPHDRFSSSTTDTVNFEAEVGGTRVNAKMEYSNLTNIRLFLHNPSNGEQIYDSQAD